MKITSERQSKGRRMNNRYFVIYWLHHKKNRFTLLKSKKYFCTAVICVLIMIGIMVFVLKCFWEIYDDLLNYLKIKYYTI